MTKLLEIASSLSTPVERRLFAEYGAMYITRATPPPVIMFAGAGEVKAFQTALDIGKAKFGEYEIELQAEATRALIAAREAATGSGLSLTARAADAGRRSYEDTVGLWLRNVERGLEYWLALGKLDAPRAEYVQTLSPVEQIAVVLEMEKQEQLYFGTFFDKSILYSVAAPGASQHLSLLAFDVAEYKDAAVERILKAHGWFRTVMNDLPHFTYLGYQENELPALGLKQVPGRYGDMTFHFWVPQL